MTARTCEIARPDWITELNAFSSLHEGWLVSLEVISTQIGAQAAAANLPLIGVTFEPGGGGAIAIGVGDLHGDRLTHVVPAPQRVAIERNERGADMALAVDSADGAKTILRFRTATLPETVDGLLRP